MNKTRRAENRQRRVSKQHRGGEQFLANSILCECAAMYAHARACFEIQDTNISFISINLEERYLLFASRTIIANDHRERM